MMNYNSILPSSGMYRIVLILSLLWAVVAGVCRFPEDWQGRWYQSGLGEVVIRDHTFTQKGLCHEHHRDYYLVENRASSCFQCLLIMKRHRNIIQYKESYCLSGDTLSDICGRIRVEAILYTLVRGVGLSCPAQEPEGQAIEPCKGSIPVRCPFQNAFHFSYNNNTGGFCRQPMSYVHACASDAKFRFLYKHCDDAAYTYDQGVTFECIATWKDGSDMFMYGGFAAHELTQKDDIYRCFMYQKLGTVVYLAMSADATCRGLRSPRDGPLVMEFTQDVHGWPVPACSFPAWFTRTTWRDLSGRRLYIPDNSGQTVSMSHRRHPHSVPHVQHTYRCMDIKGENTTSSEFVAVSFSSSDCTTIYQCVKIVRRHERVLEIYDGAYLKSESERCLESHFRDAKKHVVYPRSLRGSACPYKGRYFVTSEPPDCDLSVLTGCNSTSQIDIISSCVSSPVGSLECLQTWTEGPAMYTIAKQRGQNTLVANCFTFRDNGEVIEFTTDRRCNKGAPDIFEHGLRLTLDAKPGSCELPKEEKKVTQPVERSEEPRHDRGYTIADPEEEPEDSDYEYKNTHEFFHNNSATRIVKSDPCRLLYSLTSFLLTMVIRR